MKFGDVGPVQVGGGTQTTHLAHKGCVAALFCQLAKGRFTGVVYVECKTGGGVFSLREGRAVFFEDVREGQSVADDFLEQRLITKLQYAEIAAKVVNASADSEDVAFCQQAVRLGVLTQAQVDQEFERRIRQRLVQAIGWQECRIELDPDPESLMGILEYPQEIGPLVYLGVRTFYDEERIAPLVSPGNELYMRLLAPERDAAELFDLDEREVALLGRLRSETKLAAIIEEACADPLEVRQLVCALVLAGLLELAAAPFPRSNRHGMERSTEVRASPVGRYSSDTDVREERLGRPPASRSRMPAQDGEPSRPIGRTPPPPRPAQDAPRQAESRTALVREDRVGPNPIAQPSAVSAKEQRAPRRALSAQTIPATNPGGARARTASAPVVEATAKAEEQPQAPIARDRVRPGSSERLPEPAPQRDSTEGRPSREWRRPRMLGAALKRLDRELKHMRPAPVPVPAPAPAVAAAPGEPGSPAPAGGRSHVEHLMRMRREALDQRKREDDGKASPSAGVEAYRSAQEALRAQKFTRAHELLQKACAADPANAVYVMYCQWAAFRSNLLDEEGITKLRAELREKVSDDQHRAFAYYALGHVALVEKKDEAAERFFARALELDKENKDAERHMRILELRRKNGDPDRQNKIFGIEVGKRS